jgi:hypothetical protein
MNLRIGLPFWRVFTTRVVAGLAGAGAAAVGAAVELAAPAAPSLIGQSGASCKKGGNPADSKPNKLSSPLVFFY